MEPHGFSFFTAVKISPTIFHIDKEKMIWEPDEYRGQFVLQEVMQMGNFGRADNRFNLSRKNSHISRYLYRVKSKGRFIRYFPEETIWRPIDMFVGFCKQKLIQSSTRSKGDRGKILF